MEDINSMILHGCKLARDLELNLAAFSNNPGVLSRSCDEMVSVFGAARDRLNNLGSTSYVGQTSHELEMAVHELLRYGGGSQMSLLRQAQVLADPGRMSGMEAVGHEFGGSDVEGPTRFGGSGGEAQPVDVAHSGGSASCSHRSRGRRNDADKRTVMMPAPRMGNMEIPPEDGYTWRKYGQKEILGSRCPRSYYRCTHSKLYHCPAKKQVQRLDHDPFTFEVTYRGDHTCHMSSTAPTELMPPPPSAQQPSTSVSLLPVDFGLGSSSGAGPSSGGSGSGAGPSTVRYGRDLEFQLQLVEMADVMFNSGSSSNNSMDLIFSSGMDESGIRKTRDAADDR